MSRLLLLVLALVCMTPGNPSHAQAAAKAAAGLVQVIEYYNPGLDQYFITADPVETVLLDNALKPGWKRTGDWFFAYAAYQAPAGSQAVCRYYRLPTAGVDSHFYSAADCADVGARLGSSWVLESSVAFRVNVPASATGVCASGAPVFRLLDQATSGRRYTTNSEQRKQMIAAGWVAEGFGPDGVVFCAATYDAAPAVAKFVAGIGMRVGTDGNTYTFNATSNAQIARYRWSFGDGAVDTGSAPVHQFRRGNYLVTLAVTDVTGAVETASTAVTIAADFTGTTNVTGTTSGTGTTNGTRTNGGPTTGSTGGTSTTNSGATTGTNGSTAGGTTTTATNPGTATGTSTGSTSGTSTGTNAGTTTGTNTATTATTAKVVVTEVTPDTFTFSSIAAAAVGSVIILYTWDFGDGATGWGPIASHQYVADGTFPVVLTVLDSLGRTATATSPVTVRKSTGTNTTGQADFVTRRSGPGVVRWWSFDTTADLSPPGQAIPNFGAQRGERGSPVIDTAVSASGGGSLRIDVPSKSGANAGGAWFGNFSADLKTQFAENSTFYVQWRQRFNKAMIQTVFMEGGGVKQGGIKQAIITAGDVADPTVPYGVRTFNSCEGIGNVIQSYYQNKFSISYNSCVGSASHGPYAGFYEPVLPGPSDFRLQNGTAPYCRYSNPGDDVGNAGPGCVGWVPDEWMTFKVVTRLGPRVNGEFQNSTYELWVGREGQRLVKVIDWKPGIPGYFPLTATAGQSFGKIYLLPYMTGKDPAYVHDLAITWYDELIISTQDIPDPVGGGSTGAASGSSATPSGVSNAQAGGGTSGAAGTTSTIPTTPTTTAVPAGNTGTSITGSTANAGSATTATGRVPAWRLGKSIGQWFEVAGTANMSGATAQSGTIDLWNGLAAGGNQWWSAAASGHGIAVNATFRIDLGADTPRWVQVNAGSPSSAVTTGAYYADGLPTSRHTYYTTQYISGANARDGADRVMLFTSYGTYGTGMANAFQGGPQVDAFRVGTGQWEPAGTWPNSPVYEPLMAVAKHPVSDDVYVSAGYKFAKWTASTGTWAVLNPTGTRLVAWDYMASTIDAKRNRAVVVTDGRPYYGPTVRLQMVDLASLSVTDIPITGDLAGINTGSALVHDVDGDRYYYFMMAGAVTKVYAIHPETGASQLLTTLAGPLYSVDARAAYFPGLGGIAYLPRFSSNILFLPTR